MRSHRSTVLAAVLGGLVAAAAVLAAALATGIGEGDTRRIVTTVRDGPAASPSAVYERARRAIVRIDARPRGTPLPRGRPRLDDGVATGSGFVVDRTGLVVTNAHVVAGGPLVTVRFERGGRRYSASVVGRDRSTDLAVLRIRAGSLAPLELASSRAVRVGDPAIALGNPYGLERTLTVGVVSALGRRIEAPDGSDIDDAVQTDAAIAPGSSGGPLLDARGRVIGVNSQSGGNSIAYAVPADTLRRLLSRLRSESPRGRARRPGRASERPSRQAQPG